MGTPFKMKGPSLYSSPMKQDKLGVTPKKTQKKYTLMSSTKNDGTIEYFKVSGGGSTDGGKTFAPSSKTKISKATYDSMKGK
tara:strand:+ start:516 stop:761 length:246 start_codon:yes stop_codon:yes gene_type:complete